MHKTANQLRLSKIITALNFATLEISLTLKFANRRKKDKDYAEQISRTKMSTLVTEEMMNFFRDIGNAKDPEISQEEIRRQYRIGRQLAVAIISLGWRHVWFCTDISFNMMRDCTWKSDIIPYLVRESGKIFLGDGYVIIFLQF